ncbi:MAG: hypothetical protein WCG20_01685 [bacterium]
MNKASLITLQQANPNGLLEFGESLSYAEYATECYFSGLATIGTVNNGHELYRSKSLRHQTTEDFYKYPASSKNSLSTLFTVQSESAGDLLVVFVADISKNGRVQATLVLTDTAWQEVLASNQKVMRVEQFYLHIIEEKLQVAA